MVHRFQCQKVCLPHYSLPGGKSTHTARLSDFHRIVPRIDIHNYHGLAVTKDLRLNIHCQLILNNTGKGTPATWLVSQMGRDQLPATAVTVPKNAAFEMGALPLMRTSCRFLNDIHYRSMIDTSLLYCYNYKLYTFLYLVCTFTFRHNASDPSIACKSCFRDYLINIKRVP